MRKILLFSYLCLIFSYGKSQIYTRFFYNERWELTSRDSSTYFRTSFFDTLNLQFAGEVRDFTRHGKPVMVGFYKLGLKNGMFTTYYSSGQLESQGEFKDNKRIGEWKYYYENGNLQQDVTFTGDDFFINTFFNKDGKKVLENGTGDWRYEYEEYESPHRIIMEGHFINGKKEGDWICYYDTNEKIYEEKFKDGKFKKGMSYQYLSVQNTRTKQYYEDYEFTNKFPPPFKYDVTESIKIAEPATQEHYPFLKFLPRNATEVLRKFTGVEKPPSPKGGFAALAKFLKQNLKYPVEARRSGIMGNVMLQLVIDKDGTIQDIEVTRGLGGGCDEEAVRVIKLTSPWEPSMQNDKAVRSTILFPVKFGI